MEHFFKLDRTKIQKFKLGEEPSDFAFWQTQSYQIRMATLARLRSQYNIWKYGIAEPRLQRVYRVVKRA